MKPYFASNFSIFFENIHTHTHTHTTGPGDYSVRGNMGDGPAASIKGRHTDPEGDDTPAANAYSLRSDFDNDRGVTMKGRAKDKPDENLPG